MLQFGMSLQMPQASLLVLPGNFDLGECYLIWVYIVLKSPHQLSDVSRAESCCYLIVNWLALVSPAESCCYLSTG